MCIRATNKDKTKAVENKTSKKGFYIFLALMIGLLIGTTIGEASIEKKVSMLGEYICESKGMEYEGFVTRLRLDIKEDNIKKVLCIKDGEVVDIILK